MEPPHVHVHVYSEAHHICSEVLSFTKEVHACIIPHDSAVYLRMAMVRNEGACAMVVIMAGTYQPITSRKKAQTGS